MTDPKAEIKERVDIAELIGEYLQLKPSGAGSFKALCPFHGEKTPSFHVSTDKQIWHCFGCGKGGDCFAFIMEIDGMDFPEALRHLGNKVGIEVQRFSSAQSNENQRLLAINELASKYFEKVLLDSPSAQSAREYVTTRGITPELREKFQIGFAPDAWDTLALFLAKRGFRELEGEKAGLLLRRKQGSGMIDRFRNRLMIPLCSVQGDVVGFTARLMPGKEDGPKYMNSPETPLYHKGRLLYGLHLAKRAIKEKGHVIVVEGNLDVVASHKAGVEHVVASSGTALTTEQLDALKRFTNTIVFSFDADAAGFAAAQRGIALARTAGFDIRVAVLPAEAGKDPDEAVQKDPSLWQRAVERHVPIMQYYIDRAVAGRDLNNVDHKRAIAALLLPELGHVRDVVEREHWLQTLSDLLRTDMAALRSAIPATAAAPKPIKQATPLQKAPPATKLSKDEQAAELLLGIAIQNDVLRTELFQGAFSQDLLPTEPLQALYKRLKEQYDLPESTPPENKSFFGRLRDRLENSPETSSLVPLADEVSLLAEQLLADMPPQKGREQMQQLIRLLQSSATDRRRKALEADIRRAEAAGDHARVATLLNEYHQLRSA